MNKWYKIYFELQKITTKNQRKALANRKIKNIKHSFCPTPALDRFNLLPLSYTLLSYACVSMFCVTLWVYSQK
jgi:hypothetical protein